MVISKKKQSKIVSHLTKTEMSLVMWLYIVIIVARSVRLLPTYMCEDVHATHQLHSQFSSSFHMRVMNHNRSATKQRLHPQSLAEISRYLVLSGDGIQQCETSSGSRHKDTDQCLQVASSFCRHCSVPVPCENGSAETAVAEGGRNPIAGLWGRTLGEN